MLLVPWCDLKRQHNRLGVDLQAAIADVLQSGHFFDNEEFERKFADLCECKFCIACSSGTSALLVSLLAADISGKVIVPSFTFHATIEAILFAGCQPVFCDIGEDYTLDQQLVSQIEADAVMPVHLFGKVCHIESSLPIIEDACQAHGASGVGYGKAACFSFYPSKNLGGLGDGGAIVSNDEGFAERARQICNHGRRESRGQVERAGFNFRMDAMQSKSLIVKLKCLNEWNEQRRRIAAIYDTAFNKQHSDSVYHCYTIEVPDVDCFVKRMNDLGVEVRRSYMPCHEIYSVHLDLPVTQHAAEHLVWLPIFPYMTDQEVEYVIGCANRCLNG